jgi:hypothetical protein
MNTRTDLCGELLLESLPTVIETDSENERLKAEVDAYQDCEGNLLSGRGGLPLDNFRWRQGLHPRNCRPPWRTIMPLV